MIRSLKLTVSIILVTLLLFDVAAYTMLPRPLTVVLSDYRKPGTSQARQKLQNNYPSNYYLAHPVRGHDIAPGVRQQHYIHELGQYDIWSNELGCFDEPVDTQVLDSDYIYLAGDSFTWGFTPHEAHFGSLLQTATGVRTIKCGVAGTGQRHQFDKFVDTTTQLGHLPRLVIVNYVANDISDDYAYPGFTVIDGWLASTKEIGPTDELLQVSEATLRQRMKDHFARGLLSTGQDLKAWLIEHSLSLNLLRAAWRAVKNQDSVAAASDNPGSTADQPARRGFWLLTGGYDHYPSDVNTIAAPNLAAIKSWQQHAEQNHYQLVISLIAYTRTPDFRNYFADLRERLTRMGVCVVDSSLALTEADNPAGYFWSVDGHFNPDGHRFYTSFLSSVLSDMYSGTTNVARHGNALGAACVPQTGMQLSAWSAD